MCLTAHPGRYDAESQTLIACDTADSLTVGANQTYGFCGDVVAHTLRGEGHDASEDGTGRGTPLVTVPTLTSNGDAHSGYRDAAGLVPISFDLAQITSAANRTRAEAGLPSSTLAKQSRMHVATGAVRRLTPRECAKLQGFPPWWCEILYRGRPAADGPQYKAYGNSMAVPVPRWIGKRISLFH